MSTNISLRLEIPGLPRMQNNSGRPTHWAVKNKEVKKWHQAVASAVMEAGKSPIRLPLKRAKLRLTRFSTVRPDTDGLVSGFKAVIDGLVKAGVLFNDKYENIGFPEYLWDKAPPKAGRLQVVVIPVPEEQEELPI